MNNKLLNKDDMISFLEQNKFILTKEIYEYLEGIVYLEYSALKDLITIEQRKALVDMQLYRSSLIYNIYNRDKKYYSDIYYNAGILLFGTNIQRGDIIGITLFNWINNYKNLSPSSFNEKRKLVEEYLENIKKDYDLDEKEFENDSKVIKKLPGIVVRKNFMKYHSN